MRPEFDLIMEHLGAKLEELRKRRTQCIDAINEARRELDRIDYAIHVLEGVSVSPSADVKVTAKGSLRHLRTHILAVLKDRQRAMTASELAIALYHPDMAMTPAELRRRISVTTSAMYKATTPPELLSSGQKNEKSEILWIRPEWMGPDGRIPLKYFGEDEDTSSDDDT